MINKSDFFNRLLIILMLMSVFFSISIRQDEGIPPVSVQGIIGLNDATNESIRALESNKPNIEIITQTTYSNMLKETNFKHRVVEYDNTNEPSKVEDSTTGQTYDIIENSKDNSKDDSKSTISKRNEIIDINKEINTLKVNRTIQFMIGAGFIFICLAFFKISLDSLLDEGGFYIG